MNIMMHKSLVFECDELLKSHTATIKTGKLHM